jgi:hypothetical protein
MHQRRHFLQLLFAAIAAACTTVATAEQSQPKHPRIAAVVTEYRHNSHADVIVSRLLQTETLDGKGRKPELQLVSLYTDQVPENDTSRKLSQEFGFPIYDTVEGALTLGTGKLAVDGVLLIAEHGKYARSDTGQIVYPKRRLFEQVAETFEKTGGSVPVFVDKHLADNWTDAKWIYDTAARLKAPLMAGSSLPVLWRYPPADTARGAKVDEIVAVSYHTLDAYGFHAMEMVQTLLERRAGGETGIAAVQCLTGDAVWQAGDEGVYDKRLLALALERLKERPIPKDKSLPELVKEPILFVIDYRDGTKARVLTLNGAVAEWSCAWRDAEGRTDSTLFWTQEARPFQHFAHLLRGIEKMFHTGEPAWPAERTLLTSGALDALLISKRDGGPRLQTPYLNIAYETKWNWEQPPEPVPGRPIPEQ